MFATWSEQIERVSNGYKLVSKRITRKPLFLFRTNTLGGVYLWNNCIGGYSRNIGLSGFFLLNLCYTFLPDLFFLSFTSPFLSFHTCFSVFSHLFFYPSFSTLFSLLSCCLSVLFLPNSLSILIRTGEFCNIENADEPS
jgi:hypothetical protein